ncbi:aldo/keto reductase [Sphingomonas sp. AX6]|uniref:aldo/keto reductase n=1 Tax=Sphingomonas sp. AX6 TaxID=2653171 RepID=UPI0012EF4321|nr:aldo/keto reductase [Sphingomonas sp. AX6]VXC85351.1 hypothetical protein SPHINGOAX6_50461 [Sphingomonas sp. AX6]
MMRRRLGRTGLSVSELSFGTGAMAGAAIDGAALSDAFAAAFSLGIDTVELEAGDRPVVDILAAALKRAPLTTGVQILCRISPLIPLDLPAPHLPIDRVYPGAHIRAQVEDLLARLGIERLALVHLPVWASEWLNEGDWRQTLIALQDEGKIAGFGIALFDHDVDAASDAIMSGLIASVQAMYNVFDRGAERRLLALCAKHDVAMIARSSLYYGALAGQTAWTDWRNAYFYPQHRAETVARVAAFEQDCEGDPRAIALRLCLTPAAVCSVAVGMRNRAQVVANVAAAEVGPLDAERFKALAKHRWLC